jgi:hypothetical protein
MKRNCWNFKKKNKTISQVKGKTYNIYCLALNKGGLFRKCLVVKVEVRTKEKKPRFVGVVRTNEKI